MAGKYLPSLSLYFSKTIESTNIVQTPFKSLSEAIYTTVCSIWCPFNSMTFRSLIPKFWERGERLSESGTVGFQSRILAPPQSPGNLCIWGVPTNEVSLVEVRRIGRPVTDTSIVFPIVAITFSQVFIQKVTNLFFAMGVWARLAWMNCDLRNMETHMVGAFWVILYFLKC